MSTPKTYAGSCHCGKVTYDVTLPEDLGTLTSCNCSICARTGARLTFVPASQFTLRSGEDALTDYTFNKKRIHHLFCATCGVRSFARGAAPDGREMVAINVRCLEGVDAEAIPVKRFDGKSL
jgi:hypothetical protein